MQNITRLAIFPLIERSGWVFRTSVADSARIMIMAFGPNNNFLIRYFLEENKARAFIEEVTTPV